MKRTLTTVLSLFIVLFSYAQINPAPVEEAPGEETSVEIERPERVKVIESERSLVSKGVSTNALSVDLSGASEKIALNVWKDFIKAHGARAKKQKRTNEWLSQGATVGTVNSSQPVDVVAKVEENANGSKLTLWIQMTDDLFVSSSAFPNDHAAAEEFLQLYVIEVNKTLIQMELDDENKKLKKLEDELKKLKRQNEAYHRTIKDAEEKIAKAKKNIETNVKEQEDSNADIDEQRKTVESVKKKLGEM